MALLVETRGDGLQVLLQCTPFGVAAVDEVLVAARCHIRVGSNHFYANNS
jgi:hypothetical protein